MGFSYSVCITPSEVEILCLVGKRCSRRAEQAHQSLHIRGRAGHQLLYQYFRFAAVTRAAATVSVHDFAELPFDLRMFAANGRVLQGLRLPARAVVLGLIVRLADCAAIFIRRRLNTISQQRTRPTYVGVEERLGGLLLVIP